jgi:hypothetical protein
VLRDALRALHAAGVAVMPLKGVLLRRLVYDDFAERPVGDVDLLVRGRDVRRAHEALVGAGFAAVFLETAERERCFRHPRHGMLVDLHWQLFYEDYFDLDAEGLFARATLLREGFACPVWRMSDADLYAHVLAHLGFSAWVSEAPRGADVPRITARLKLDPAALAAHLTARRMDRFARYALRYLIRATGDAHARAVLAALPRDPLGDALGAAVLAVMPRLRERPYLAYAPRRMLYRSGEMAVENALILAGRGARWLSRKVKAGGQEG